MSVTVDPMVKSLTIIWEDGDKEVSIDVIDGRYEDPEAVEISHILEYERGFRAFLSAIKKAMRDTAD